ncbi:hypothetical protein AB0M54_09450 [Actinoplanes sp. NPDC051470]|uniref:class I fructose-bisphosphate aldolase n=1 Tax=unclassified Actinoplanes TaxID=2626549 RepID=UPI00341A6123
MVVGGAERRLRRLVPRDRPALWLPLDDGLISGPEDHLRDVRALLTPDVVENVTAVLGFRGSVAAAHEKLLELPVVMNLSASTTLVDHTRKVAVGSVLDAVRAGADAIACHVNMTSPYQAEQLAMLSTRVSEADNFGMPVVAFAYPRGLDSQGVDDNHLALRERSPEEFAALVRHGVRAVIELGATVVKTIYTGTVDSFRTVVESAMGVPVLIAGESLSNEAEAIVKATQAIQAGASGVAYGRQIFSRPRPVPFLAELRKTLEVEWLNSRSPGSAEFPSELGSR